MITVGSIGCASPSGWTQHLRHKTAANFLAGLALAVFFLAAAMPTAVGADAAFDNFLQSLRPQAQRLGVSRPTFDAATRGLEPDLSLPDLIIPGRPERAQPGQAEFVQAPADYLKETTIERLAVQGRKLLQEHRATLSAIEQRFGVPGPIVLAIWGRETDFGRYKNSLSAIRVLATQAFYGRRKEQFTQEFLLALKMLQEGRVTLANMKSSWAGAMGLTQFLPSDFYKNGVDFDGDGRIDIWTSIPDALASTAKQLVDKGWERGGLWAVEVRAPKSVDCTIGVPENKKTNAEWLRAGFVPTRDRKLRAEELAEPASLLQPEGLYGPSFLVTKNYFVIKEYNFSDLYVLFVGHVSDRISDPRPFETPWSKVVLLKTADVERMQQQLTAMRIYGDKIDGKAGMKTRAAVGAYQKAEGLAVDCWPTVQVLNHMRATR
jgi:lytic murein transglycosylase